MRLRARETKGRLRKGKHLEGHDRNEHLKERIEKERYQWRGYVEELREEDDGKV